MHFSSIVVYLIFSFLGIIERLTEKNKLGQTTVSVINENRTKKHFAFGKARNLKTVHKGVYFRLFNLSTF